MASNKRALLAKAATSKAAAWGTRATSKAPAMAWTSDCAVTPCSGLLELRVCLARRLGASSRRDSPRPGNRNEDHLVGLILSESKE